MTQQEATELKETIIKTLREQLPELAYNEGVHWSLTYKHYDVIRVWLYNHYGNYSVTVEVNGVSFQDKTYPCKTYETSKADDLSMLSNAVNLVKKRLPIWDQKDQAAQEREAYTDAKREALRAAGLPAGLTAELRGKTLVIPVRENIEVTSGSTDFEGLLATLPDTFNLRLDAELTVDQYQAFTQWQQENN